MMDLETLDAIEDIRALEARYARYADHKRWKDLAGLFTEDGWFRTRDAEGNEIAHMAGREDIATQLGARNSGDVQPIHQLLTHEIEIESAVTAKAIWAMADLIFRGDSAVPRNAGMGPLPRHLSQGGRPVAHRDPHPDPDPARVNVLSRCQHNEEGNAPMTDFEKDRFTIAIPQETIDDLKDRLRNTRWPADIDENDGYYGTSLAYMKELVGSWANEF